MFWTPAKSKIFLVPKQFQSLMKICTDNDYLTLTAVLFILKQNYHVLQD